MHRKGLGLVGLRRVKGSGLRVYMAYVRIQKNVGVGVQ